MAGLVGVWWLFFVTATAAAPLSGSSRMDSEAVTADGRLVPVGAVRHVMMRTSMTDKTSIGAINQPDDVQKLKTLSDEVRAVKPGEDPNISPEERAFKRFSPEELGDVQKLRAAANVDAAQCIKYFRLQDELEQQLNATKGRKPRALICGANNGVLCDLLFPVVFAHEWPVTLIEANPRNFKDLKANYGKKHHGQVWDGVQFINQAILDKAGSVSMAVPKAGSEGWKKATASVTKNATVPANKEWEEVIKVKGDTLGHLLAEQPAFHGRTDFDIVQIDVEGMDELVLKQLDALPWRPSVLCIETCKEFCHTWMTTNNYKVEKLPGNTCAHKN